MVLHQTIVDVGNPFKKDSELLALHSHSVMDESVVNSEALSKDWVKINETTTTSR